MYKDRHIVKKSKNGKYNIVDVDIYFYKTPKNPVIIPNSQTMINI